MNNYEFHRETIRKIEEKGTYIAISVNNAPVSCDGTIHCEDCKRRDSDKKRCSDIKLLEWTMAEHEEPRINLPSDIAVDTPILVSSDGKLWEKRHFAQFGPSKNKLIVGAWIDGRTSYSVNNEDDTAYWQYAKLPEDEQK